MIRAVLLCILCVLTACSPVPGKVLVGQEAPLMRFYTLADGDETNLESYRGKPVVLVFWRSDCGSSKRALAAINAYARQPRQQGKYVFIAANMDESDKLSAVKEVLRERKITAYEQMMSGNAEYDQAFKQVLGDRVPYIVVVDADGIIRMVTDDRDDITGSN